MHTISNEIISFYTPEAIATMKFQIALVLLVAFVSASNANFIKDWIKKTLGQNQAKITERIQNKTVELDGMRQKHFPETVQKVCHQFTPAIDKFEPAMITGKFYANLRSNDLFQVSFRNVIL